MTPYTLTLTLSCVLAFGMTGTAIVVIAVEVRKVLLSMDEDLRRIFRRLAEAERRVERVERHLVNDMPATWAMELEK